MDDINDVFAGNAFDGPAPDRDREPAPPPAAEELATGAPEPTPQPSTTVPPAAKDDDGEEDAPPASEDGRVPVAALLAERNKRKDYKTAATKWETEAQMLRQQLEEARKGPPPAPPAPAAPPPPLELPDPISDPQGYHQAIIREAENRAFNERLNISEMMLRQQYQDVDEKFALFQEAIKANPALGAELRRQQHPWKWMYDEAGKIAAHREIGDPTAYRAKLEAEIRAQIQAEAAQSAPTAPPATRLPPSLAGVRSSAPRSDRGISGDTSIRELGNPAFN